MTQLVEVSIRASLPLVELVQDVGDEGVTCILKAFVMLDTAMYTRRDRVRWRCLLERAYLYGLIDDLVKAKNLLRAEAYR